MKIQYRLLFFLCLFFQACATSPTIKPPVGMTYLEGGVVTVGEYKEDDTHWGRREAYIKPFFIDIEPGPVSFNAYHSCAERKGRLPEEAELNYALNFNKIVVGKNLEVTQSDINYAGTQGGRYNLRVLGAEKLKIMLPSKDDVKGGFQRRCLIPLNKFVDLGDFTIKEDTHPRTGRGDQWAQLPLLLKKNQVINIFYKDKDWALVDLDVDGPDSGGWVPLERIVGSP